MLNRVLDAVRQRGWFDTSEPFEMSVHLTQGACVWLLLSRHGRLHTHVKFSESISLTAEAACCEAASASYGGLAPAYVGHAQSAGLHVLVCRAMGFLGLDAALLLSDRRSALLRDGLVNYFQRMPAAKASPHPLALANAEIRDRLTPYFRAISAAHHVQAWLDRAMQARLARLPSLAQHGDLVLNNMGKSDAGPLVIFDWEDFGAVQLPGLDMFTLELSLSGDVDGLLSTRRLPQAPLTLLVARCCGAIGLAMDDYRYLTPVYALIFRYFKRNYGAAVRVRLDQVLNDLAATAGHAWR